MRTSEQQYLRQVKGMLMCFGKEKRAILSEIKANLSAFLDQHPDADLSAIEARFGTPQAIASAYLSIEDPSVLVNRFRIRNTIVGIIAAAAISVALIWGICYVAITYHHMTEFPGYIEITKTQGESIPDPPPWYHE